MAIQHFTGVIADGFQFYRDGQKWLLRGVTYGPFEPRTDGDCYPDGDIIDRDFRSMAECGVNTVRVYNVPSARVAEYASQYGLLLLIDIPWPKHLDVYGTGRLRQMSLDLVEEGVRKAALWTNVLGILLGNEIPADIVRWNGREKIERLLLEMYRRAKAIAPHLLIGFANFPSTEYLELDFLDFIGFNVYLNAPASLYEYLVRLRHLYPDKPLVLSECGLDSRSNGVGVQAQLLPEFICRGFEVGLAGVLVFAWTDKWFTGGQEIVEWDFGMVDRSGQPKPSYFSVKECFRRVPQCRHVKTPISLVIATYNGGRTLRQCLGSIEKLNYPNFETIIVDDGSTDDTTEILQHFPCVKVIAQENRGLSSARNAGIKAAKGDIVVFTDSDCVVDSDWLYFIALFLQENSEMVGVGGPNITLYENSITQRAIALAPGHATHVLISHTEAEHVPGCNMAFKKQALDEIGGFDTTFRKAGDDVDVIWRLQDAGYAVGFSTAAFVWHHRRPTFSAYIKQQAGYGEAETLLLKKHPHRFTDTGQSVWRGVIYPTHSMRLIAGTKRIRYGIFGTAGYQCIYYAPPAMWFYYVTSLEWWVLALVLILAGFASPLAVLAGAAAVLISLSASAWAVVSNWPSSSRYRVWVFPLVWLLWIIQPLVRSGARYWYRLKLFPGFRTGGAAAARRPDTEASSKGYFWSDQDGPWRAELLQKVATAMQERQMICSPNNPWEPWDLSVVLSSWFRVRITTMEECLGGKKRQLKLKLQLVPSTLLYMFVILGLTTCFFVALYHSIFARWILTICLTLLLWAYRYALRGRSEVWCLTEEVITAEGYYPVVKNSGISKYVTQPKSLERLSADGEV